MSEDYVKVFNPDNKNLTFTKVNKMINTNIDYPLNFKSNISKKWVHVDVLEPSLSYDSQPKFKQTGQSSVQNIYSSKYKTK